MKIGSLFDGSGGFPLAASLCGIEPVWAAEIEQYPIAVTRSRFPNMKHLGSVTDINGAEIEPVDVITFGSPCQDLSVAGKRAGLKHTENGDDETTRSGLFMEAIRIIKEMREATNGVYPRIAVWENVPGAFSSNKGLDFRVVLEELIRIAEPTAVMPEVPKAGWAYADVYSGDGWSLAYRVLDAQYWGVPQRRRRIYLVADFRGQCAGKISFEREGLRGYFAQSGAEREAVAGYAETCTGAADCYGIDHAITTGGNCTAQGPCVYENIQATLKACGPHAVAYTLKIRSGCEGGGKGALIQTDMSATLATNNDQYLFMPVALENHPADSRVKVDDSGKVQTLTSRMGTGGGNVPLVMDPVAYNGENITSPVNKANPKPGDPCHTLGTDSRNYLVYCLQGNGIDRADTAGCNGRGWNDETCYTLNTIDRPAVAYGVDCRNGVLNGDLCGTLQAKPNGGFSYNCTHPVIVKTPIRYIVRRLTPTECARLQGFPDNWGHIDEKADFTDEEYAFWLDVRNTHAAINDRVVKDYTKDQMLTWYNKLHTDSSEYKLWGNGIALPCALYVMQGIAEGLYEN